MATSSTTLGVPPHRNLLIALLLSAVPLAASGRVLFVANNGLDSVNCGTWSAPCRSITRAIGNGVDGDQIEVGAGRYGDLDADGELNDAGEEGAQLTTDGGMVTVDKRLAIYSQKGASATIIDAAFVDLDQVSVVRIIAHGASFGRTNGGFTLIGGGALSSGMQVDVGNVRIAGNMALNHAVGFILSPKRGRIVASGNTAIGNHAGFLARGFNPADFVLLVNNVATGNVGMGFELTGTAPHVAVGNRSDANHDGFAVSGGPFQFRQNTVVGNTGVGFIVTNSGGPFEGGHLFRENSVIGNRDPGFVFTGRGNNTVRRNNIFGNGDCGIFNQSNFVVTATQNFWGLPSGPGVDPADAAGPPCDARGSTTVTTPFATSAFPIN